MYLCKRAHILSYLSRPCPIYTLKLLCADALHVPGPRHHVWRILCDIAGEDLRGTGEFLSFSAALSQRRKIKTSLLLFTSAETRSEWRCCRGHLHGSWQFCSRAFCIRHWYAPTQTHMHKRVRARSQMVVSPLILTGCLLVCRCLHHPRWRGGGDHRRLSGLQHPMHHWCLWDLRWTGVCVCVREREEEWLTAADASFSLFIDCRAAAHVWQKFFAEGENKPVQRKLTAADGSKWKRRTKLWRRRRIIHFLFSNLLPSSTFIQALSITCTKQNQLL